MDEFTKLTFRMCIFITSGHPVKSEQKWLRNVTSTGNLCPKTDEEWYMVGDRMGRKGDESSINGYKTSEACRMSRSIVQET